MESIQWKVLTFNMLLLLKFDHNIDDNDVNDSAFRELFNRGRIRSPWPESWQIAIVYIPFARNVTMELLDPSHIRVSKRRIVECLDHFYVSLYYKHRTVYPSQFVKAIKATLAKPWYFDIDGKAFRARQSFSKFTFSKVLAYFGNTSPPNIYMPSWQLSPGLTSLERRLYKLVSLRRRLTSGYYINKLMFCRQVEMPSTNFNISSFPTVALYYKRMDSFFFNHEFTKSIDINNEPIFRVCLSDILLTSGQSRQGPNYFRHLLMAIYFIRNVRQG